MEEIEEMNDPKPSLFVETLSHEVKILSNFELLKMQIMSKVQGRQAPERGQRESRAMRMQQFYEK